MQQCCDFRVPQVLAQREYRGKCREIAEDAAPLGFPQRKFPQRPQR